MLLFNSNNHWIRDPESMSEASAIELLDEVVCTENISITC